MDVTANKYKEGLKVELNRIFNSATCTEAEHTLNGTLWFRLLIHTNTGKLLRILGGLMEQTFGESFERRVPAKAVSDVFIEMTGLCTDRKIRH